MRRQKRQKRPRHHDGRKALQDLDAQTKIIALIGDPVEHSLTPHIQNAALKSLGVNVCNLAFRVPKGCFHDALRGAKAMGFLGLMVTIPHKESAFRCADEADESARLMGSANLLVIRDGGGGNKRIAIAYSTDGYAASRSLREAGFEVRGKRVAIVGTGGAGRALAFQFVIDGALELLLFNRTLKRAHRLAQDLKRKLGFGATQVFPLDPQALRDKLRYCDLLINATPVGMHPREDETPVPSGALHRDLFVFDIVYNPIRTRLLEEAQRKGCRTLGGVPMLVYTNEKALSLCLNTPVPEKLVALMVRRCYGALGD